jgi:hypothetical protein
MLPPCAPIHCWNRQEIQGNCQQVPIEFKQPRICRFGVHDLVRGLPVSSRQCSPMISSTTRPSGHCGIFPKLPSIAAAQIWLQRRKIQFQEWSQRGPNLSMDPYHLFSASSHCYSSIVPPSPQAIPLEWYFLLRSFPISSLLSSSDSRTFSSCSR